MIDKYSMHAYYILKDENVTILTTEYLTVCK